MFGVKKLAGLAMFANGAEALPLLRFALCLFSLLGIVCSLLLIGNQIDPDSVSALIRMALETGICAFVSHWICLLIRKLIGR